MMDCKSYMKNKVFLENKEIFIYRLKHIKTKKIKIYRIIGCESDELYEKDKLFNMWSNKFINKEVEKRDFKITGWHLMTVVKRNNFFKIPSIVCIRK